MNLFKNLFISLSFLGLFLALPIASYASRLYLVPSQSFINKDQNVTVEVRLDTKDASVNAISAFVTYPSNLLEIVQIQPASTFSVEAENTYDSDAVKLSRGNVNPVLGDVEVAKVTFHAKNEGNALLSFTKESVVPKASDSSDSLQFSESASIGVVSPSTVSNLVNAQDSSASSAKTSGTGSFSVSGIVETIITTIKEILSS